LCADIWTTFMSAAQTNASVRQGWRIAVVDDDPGVRRSISRLLRAAGFDVFTFESAEGFLNGATTAFACLVLDVQLGGRTGIDLYGHLEECRRSIPVVFITSHEEYLDSALPGERRAWLRKPFEARDLIGAIHRVIVGASGEDVTR
jgi:FixJ family two-component response regulator